MPNVMVTVPACDDCNAKKSLHDDFLRDLLTSDAAGGESPIAQQIFQQKVLSSHQQGKSLLARIVVDEAKETPIFTKSGLYLGDCYVAHFDLDRSIEMFSFIVRGLYYRLRQIVLPQDCKCDVRRLGDEDAKQWWEFFEEYKYNGPYALGDKVFWCVYNYAARDDSITFWMLVFYDRVIYRVLTAPAGFDWDPNTDSAV
ncbi:MAG TPA: hypothetical protein PKD64_15145 [Pirellulaceae bacterium]|nr:hypothetical protein [Pirellulaceae bacterium]